MVRPLPFYVETSNHFKIQLTANLPDKIYGQFFEWQYLTKKGLQNTKNYQNI